jgi:adenosylcobinamide kinase/adenosylcobinamide-phosphate guanylyltransferase
MITLISGGIKSGKSRFAFKLSDIFTRKLFIATLENIDYETEEKIYKHKQGRNSSWLTIEEPVNIVNILKNNIKSFDVILLECINIWINNLIYHKSNISEHIDMLIDFLSINKNAINIVIVTNEVGQSIIPANKISRDFINILGITPQKIAAIADVVYLLVAGIPLKIKG